MNSKKEIKVKSLSKAIQVLNCFAEKQPLGITEISNMLDLYKSNVYDILTTFAAMGYLEQSKESGKYYLGIGICKLSKALGDRYSFRNLALAHIKEISNEVGELTCLTVPVDDKVYYLDVAYPSNTNMHLYGAFRDSMDEFYCTSCGKAMLANMPEAYVEDYLTREMKPLTEYTITSPEKLRAELAAVRLRGYATDIMENSVGLNCTAVPILSRSREVMGAISVSGPSERMSAERLQKLSEIIRSHVDILQRES